MIVGGSAVYSLSLPYRGFPDERFLDFDRGTSSRVIARDLARAGIVRFQWQFLLARALRPAQRLQAGEYRFRDPASVWNVFDRMARGDVFYYELTIPEGSNLFDIAGAVASLGFLSAEDFLAAASQPGLIRDLDPQAPTLEGYLFPSTYRVTRHTTAGELCRQMVDQFRRHWKPLAGENSANPHQVVTLASLIEKETAVAAERPLVSSVYHNRLAKGMLLQCDPTVIYADLLDGRYRGAIYRSDLASRNTYNTYEHAGLPPGPIANPGVASLEAAMHPAQTDYLYFVAKPDGAGAHQFSATLAAHQKAVKVYRRALKKGVKTR